MSGPAVASSSAAVSRTLRVRKPSMAMPAQPSPAFGPSGSRARVAFRPNNPHDEAGMRTDPPPPLPCAIGPPPADTAAADPDEDPPATWPRFHGLRVGRPYTPASPVGPMPNSGLVVRPNVTRPARSNLVNSSESPA